MLDEAQALDNNWGDNGNLRLAAHVAIGGLTGGLSGALATGLGALAGGGAGNPLTGAAGGFNEVTNNYLAPHKRKRLEALKEKAKQGNLTDDEKALKLSLEQEDAMSNKNLKSYCDSAGIVMCAIETTATLFENRTVLDNANTFIENGKVDYISVNIDFYVGSIAGAVNLGNGNTYFNVGLSRTYPHYTLKLGGALVVGRIPNATTPKDIDNYLTGAGNSSAGFIYGVGGGVGHAYGGNSSIFMGVGTPGYGVSPFGYGNSFNYKDFLK